VLCCFPGIEIDTFVVCVCLSGLRSLLSNRLSVFESMIFSENRLHTQGSPLPGRAMEVREVELCRIVVNFLSRTVPLKRF
jgi:hypothetical protein